MRKDCKQAMAPSKLNNIEIFGTHEHTSISKFIKKMQVKNITLIALFVVALIS